MGQSRFATGVSTITTLKGKQIKMFERNGEVCEAA
jgi:hypothetical protein